VSNYAGTDGIAVRGDLGGLTLSTVPKVMIEHGNMRHGGDVRIMRSTWQRDRMANAIVAAIVTWERSHPLN
jgi:N-acetylmuramoyl-L-alanine amidase